MTTFALVVITVTGLTYGDRTWEGYYPQSMVPSLSYEECHAIADKAVVWRDEQSTDEMGSWWIESRIACWPEIV